MNKLTLSLYVIVGAQTCMAQITAAGGQNVKELSKKHDDLTKVWTHTQDHGWASSIDFAINTASGNSETGYFTAGLTLDKKRGQNSYYTKFSYAYGEESGSKSMDELLGVASWKRTGSGGYYTGARFDFRQDALADIDYRLGATVLQGYNLYVSEKGWVTPEVGLGFSSQQIGGEERDRMNSYVGLHAEYWLNEKSRLYTSLIGFVPFVDSSEYYCWGELGVETLLTDKLSLKLYFQDSYENAPASGRKHNDLRFIAGISVKL